MESEFLSYADLVKLEREEREELELTKKVLSDTRNTLSQIEKWWRDSSQANALLSSRIHTIDSELTEKLEEEKRQKLVWKEAYESVTGSKTWRMMSRIKRLFGKKTD